MMVRKLRFKSTTGRRGFTLIESVMCILIVSVMFVAAMSVTANSRVNQQLTADHSQGVLLADMLMTEILQKAYIGVIGSSTLGRDLGESSTNRKDWDDVDDYHGWTASPPKEPDGTDLSGLEGWERSVVVSYVNPANLKTKSVGSDTGIKHIEVTVKHNGRIVAKLVTLRTGAKDTVVEDENPIKELRVSELIN